MACHIIAEFVKDLDHMARAELAHVFRRSFGSPTRTSSWRSLSSIRTPPSTAVLGKLYKTTHVTRDSPFQSCASQYLPYQTRYLHSRLQDDCTVVSLFCGAISEASSSTEISDLVSQLEDRGLVESCSNGDALRALLQKEKIGVYCGFDPTADSLHLGNLLGIVMLTWFHRYGHVPVALIGGATGRVGDPSGKQSERPLLTESQLERNTKSISALLSGIFKRNTNTELKILNNLDWFREMSALTFLRDVGKHARVGTMLARESVKARLNSEAGISFTEFSYQLLQGYDFYRLCRDDGVSLQVGGSDQWGNITTGFDLVRRLWPSDRKLPEVHGLTFPLLLDSEGRKFGKSEGGVVWLSAEKLSPYKFYQYLFSTTDADIIRFLKMLTLLPTSEIQSIETSMKETGYRPNTAQRRLAEEVTRFVHGEEGLKQALTATEALRPGSETKLDISTLMDVAGEAPTASLSREDVINAFLTDVLMKVQLQDSKSAGKRMIRNGGIRVNNIKVDDEMMKLTVDDLIDGQMMLLSSGKKNKLLLKVK